MKNSIMSMVISMILMCLFFMSSKKFKTDKSETSAFESGFTPFYHTRSSFSIHYLIISLIFLFFDLELCFLMPFLSELNSSVNVTKHLFLFAMTLIMGLLIEWKNKKIEWND